MRHAKLALMVLLEAFDEGTFWVILWQTCPLLILLRVITGQAGLPLSWVITRLTGLSLLWILKLTSLHSLILALGNFLVTLVQLHLGNPQIIVVPADAFQLALSIKTSNDLADAVLFGIVNTFVSLKLFLLFSLWLLLLRCRCRHNHTRPICRLIALRTVCTRVCIPMQIVEIILALRMFWLSVLICSLMLILVTSWGSISGHPALMLLVHGSSTLMMTIEEWWLPLLVTRGSGSSSIVIFRALVLS